jgi:adenine deaminase
MQRALEAIIEMDGGLVVTQGGDVLAALPLPIAGLMSDRPLREVADTIESLHDAYHRLGGELSDPFMTLAFLALAVIPSLKITDKGLVDVDQFKLVSLWVDEAGE